MSTTRRVIGIGLLALASFFLAVLSISVLAPFGLKACAAPVNPKSGKTIDLAHSWVQIGVIQYRAIHGRFPDSWQEVVQEELIQAPLLSMDGLAINPDDHQIDFPGDIQYLKLDDDNAMLVQSVRIGNQGRITNFPISAKPSYASIISSFDGTLESGNSRFLSDEQNVLMMGFAGVYRLAAEDYRTIFDEYPKSFAELVSSGVSPLPDGAINPISGSAFAGDGGPWDVVFDLSPNGEMWITPTFADGEQPEGRMVY